MRDFKKSWALGLIVISNTLFLDTEWRFLCYTYEEVIIDSSFGRFVCNRSCGDCWENGQSQCVTQGLIWCMGRCQRLHRRMWSFVVRRPLLVSCWMIDKRKKWRENSNIQNKNINFANEILIWTRIALHSLNQTISHKSLQFIPNIWFSRKLCVILQTSLRERAAPRQLERALLHSACTVLAVSKH